MSERVIAGVVLVGLDGEVVRTPSGAVVLHDDPAAATAANACNPQGRAALVWPAVLTLARPEDLGRQLDERQKRRTTARHGEAARRSRKHTEDTEAGPATA